MIFNETKFKGAFTIELKRLKDERGYFERLLCTDELQRIGFNKKIVQVNHSFTAEKGSCRGMHLQLAPYAETKIIKCLRGAALDFAIDLRKNSKTFLQWMAIEINQSNNTMVFLPEGFAHGFQTLENNTELIYFHSEFFNPKAEIGINIQDPQIGVQLPLEIANQSEKDKALPFFNQLGGIVTF